MERGRQDSRHDLHLRAPRYDAPEVEDELGRVMQDVGEVDVMPLGGGLIDGHLKGNRLVLAHGGSLQGKREAGSEEQEADR